MCAPRLWTETTACEYTVFFYHFPASCTLRSSSHSLCCLLAGSNPPPPHNPVTQHASPVKTMLSGLSSRGYHCNCLKLCLVVRKVMFLGTRPSSK